MFACIGSICEHLPSCSLAGLIEEFFPCKRVPWPLCIYCPVAGFSSSQGKLTTADAGVKKGPSLVDLCPRLSSCGGYLGWLSPWLLARAVECTVLAVEVICWRRARLDIVKGRLRSAFGRLPGLLHGTRERLLEAAKNK